MQFINALFNPKQNLSNKEQLNELCEKVQKLIQQHKEKSHSSIITKIEGFLTSICYINSKNFSRNSGSN